MRLSELNIREDDLDDKVSKTLKQMGLRADPNDRPTLSNTNSNTNSNTKLGKTDAANLGKKVNNLDDKPNRNAGRGIASKFFKIPVIGPMFRFAFKLVGAAAVPAISAAAWATQYFNYVTGVIEVPGQQVPCKNSSWTPGNDPILDIGITNPNFTWTGYNRKGKKITRRSFGAQMADTYYSALPAVLTSLATRAAIAAKFASLLRLISAAGGVAGFFASMAVLITSTAAAFFVDRLVRRLDAWGRPFAELWASRTMYIFASDSGTKMLCGLGNWLNESQLNENFNSVNSKRLDVVGKEFKAAIDETLQDLKSKDPKMFRKANRLLARAKSLQSTSNSPFGSTEHSDDWEAYQASKSKS